MNRTNPSTSPSDATPGDATPTTSGCVLDGVTMSTTANDGAGAVTAAFDHLDAALEEAGRGWDDVRVLVIRLEPELPGTASWTVLGEHGP